LIHRSSREILIEGSSMRDSLANPVIRDEGHAEGMIEAEAGGFRGIHAEAYANGFAVGYLRGHVCTFRDIASMDVRQASAPMT